MPHRTNTAEKHGHHIVPKKTLIRVFLALIALTILTVSVVLVDLGPFNVPIALGIAGIKAGLVVMIFMGLKYDSPMNVLVLTVGILFVVLFLTFTLFDTAFRGDLGNVAAETISETEQREELLRAREQRLSTGVPGGAAADTTAEAATDTTGSTSPDTASATPDTGAVEQQPGATAAPETPEP